LRNGIAIWFCDLCQYAFPCIILFSTWCNSGEKNQFDVNFPSTQREAQWTFFDASKVGLNLGDLSDLRTQESPESSGLVGVIGLIGL